MNDPASPRTAGSSPPLAGDEDWRRAVDAAYRGVLFNRAMAYLADFLIVLALTILFGAALFLLGFVTFGATWALMAVVAPATAVIYSAVTIGGPRRATIGMRLVGLRVCTPTGEAPGMLAAAAHALLFYVAAGTFVLWLLDVGFALFRRDRRMLRDLLTGLVVLNADDRRA